MLSVLLSAMIILTTIHVQDFPDVSGDSAIGRETIPIRFPNGSRLLTTVIMILWSVILSYVWQLPQPLFLLMCIMGTWVAYRIWFFRSEEEDKKTYVVYNVGANSNERRNNGFDANVLALACRRTLFTS